MNRFISALCVSILVWNSLGSHFAFAATLSKGHTFGATDEVTNTKLNNLVDNASISNIDQSDIQTNFGIVETSASAPSDTDSLWRDSGNDKVLKVHDGSNWVGVGDLSDISTDVGTDEDLADALENYRSGCFIYRVDGNNIGCTVGSVMINGKLRRLSSAITNQTYSAPDNDDWLDIWGLADASATTFTLSVVDSGTTPGGSSNPGTNGRLLASIKYEDSTEKINFFMNYMDNYVEGWHAFVGDGTSTISGQLDFGVTFVNKPVVNVTLLGNHSGSPPASLDDMTGVNAQHPAIWVSQIGVGNCTITMESSGTWSNTDGYGFAWIAHGRY